MKKSDGGENSERNFPHGGEIFEKMTGQNRLKKYDGDGHLVGRLRHNDGEKYGGDEELNEKQRSVTAILEFQNHSN